MPADFVVRQNPFSTMQHVLKNDTPVFLGYRPCIDISS